ncbi:MULTISPECIES: endonuclease V [Bacillus]|uniref:Endonuclease V n=2 Tax=Bacillus cereus group TaxID=86661 RepID=A0A1D3MNR9_BACMY|nr:MULTISPECIES: endonuclease V [Bacillus]EJV71226.1 endonuclease V [Bacillus cereus BAG6O-2]EOP68823.1 endonuclease V [Bacillus cereus VD118]MBJ8072436.1 endonuclease V [Bacillus cereus]MBJ8189253.1 endonuclease V [Bacillus cereus]MBM6647989.1 endonuclease V [Bacillus sp. RIT 809]
MDNAKLNVLIEEFKEEQNVLLPKVKLKNTFQLEEIRFVAGVDLAYWEVSGETYGTCCIVVIDFHTHEVIEKVYSYGEITIPYISGFLAFRELPLIKAAAKKLSEQPDIYMFDGNGYLHYRHMGIATHASFYLNRPTIGVAKSYLKINNVDFTMPEDQKGSYTDIIINNEIYGRALRTTQSVKPIFISCGNWIDLETCTEIVMRFINKESRLPIPVRLADLETHIMRKKL